MQGTGKYSSKENMDVSGESVLAGVSNYFPLYFMVKQLNEVMATEQPCDLAYEFGDGLFDLYDYPQGFPEPGVESVYYLYIT